MLVKVLRAAQAVPQTLIEQQLERLLALRHPHIHSLQDVGWTAPTGPLYLMSAYVEQGALSRYMGAASRLPALAVVGIVRQIGEALQFAHQQQIPHGRIKLENCLLVGPATVQVSDFYSLLLSPESRAMGLLSLAPEQRFGQIEPATDQYALAVVTYQLLTGQLPFNGSGSKEVFPAAEPQPRQISHVRPDLSWQMDEVLGRALSPRTHDRYPSVWEFALALQTALGPVTARPPTPAPRVISQYPPGAKPEMSPAQVAEQHVYVPSQPVAICQLPGHTAAATVLRWSPDGRFLASAGQDEAIRVWRIQRRIGSPVTTLQGHKGEVLTLAWSVDGALLASGGADATLRTWQIDTGAAESAWWGHDGAVAALDWSPDGARLASGGADRTIRIWDRRGNAVSIWQAHGRGGVTALAWSPDRHLLASGGADRVVHLWDVTADAPLVTLGMQGDDIRHLSWSPVGGLLAAYAGKKDTRVYVWDAYNGQPVVTLASHMREVVGCFWEKTGAWLATASGDSTLRFWDMRHRVGEQLSPPFYLQSSPVSMAGAAETGYVAMGLSELLIHVVELKSQS
jgi:hypothetical protein